MKYLFSYLSIYLFIDLLTYGGAKCDCNSWTKFFFYNHDTNIRTQMFFLFFLKPMKNSQQNDQNALY